MLDGTQQNDRFPAALQEGYFRVDELDFDDRVAMSAALGAQLTFFDLQRMPSGTWGEMFAADEALALARIMSLESPALQRQFLHGFEAAPLEKLALDVVRLAGWLDLWFKTLKVDNGAAARALCDRMAVMVERQLGSELRWVLDNLESMQISTASRGFITRVRERLDPVWLQVRPLQAVAVPQGRSLRELLRTRYFTFLTAVER